MLYLLVAACVAVALAAPPGGGSADSVPVWARGGSLYAELLASEPPLGNSTVNIFQQRIFHDDPARLQTFAQRWYVDYTHFSGSGPVFLSFGGEGPNGGTPGGFVATQAAALGALVVSIESRWYGASLPGAMSDKALLQQTLSVEAVLADLVAFADYFEAEWLRGVKLPWLAVGGSYAGAIASWARLTHPERFAAAWSSSGVVEAVFDYHQFDEIVRADIPAACAAALTDITARAEAAWDGSPAQRQQLLALFSAPADLSRTDFMWMLADSGAMGAQYGAKAALCAAVLPVSGDPLAQFAAWTRDRYGAGFASQCYYNTACLSDPTQSARWANQLPWVWQCCSELAYWQPGFPGSIRSRAITTDYFSAQCASAFGVGPANTTGFNQRFGGWDSAVTKVVALSGSDDPWRHACVNASRPAADVRYELATCDGCGHCGDLSAGGGAAVAAQHVLIANSLKEWLS